MYEGPRYRFLAPAAYDGHMTVPALLVPGSMGRAGMGKASRRLFSKTLCCSFCGKSRHEVEKLVAGPRVFICDSCVALCVEVLDNGRPSSPLARAPGVLDRARGWFDRLRRGTLKLVEVGR
jgi:hypothetical protein